jgi:rhodanese-related sulfurtransferase
MIRSISPREAESLIARGDLDVVDVRAAGSYVAGHIPRARSVPLYVLLADPRAALPRDGVVFVCGRGINSLHAAQAAEAAGLQDLYNLEGGTSGWAEGGLPLQRGDPALQHTG